MVSLLIEYQKKMDVYPPGAEHLADTHEHVIGALEEINLVSGLLVVAHGRDAINSLSQIYPGRFKALSVR